MSRSLITPVAIVLLSVGVALGPTARVEARTITLENSQNFFGEDNFNWLLSPDVLAPQSGQSDPAALAILSDLMSKDDPRAGQVLKNYLGRFPNDAAAFDLAGVYLMDQGNFDEAISSFQKALVLTPLNGWLRAKLGIALLRRERFDVAESELTKSLELEPENPLARRGLARLAAMQDDLPTAILHSERALRAFGLPRNTVNQAHFDLAGYYSAVGRNIGVLDLLRPAATNPNLAIPDDARIELMGRFLDAAMAANRPKDARFAYDSMAAVIDTSHPSIMLSQARLQRLEKDYDGSFATLESLAASFPQLESQIEPDRAVTLGAAGRHDEAAELWWDIARDKPEGEDTAFFRAALEARISAGASDMAIEEVTTLALNAADRSDLQLLAIELLGKAGASDKALEMARVMTGDHPDNAEAWRMLGILAKGTGDDALGRSALETSLELNPKEPTTWLTLAGTIHGHGSYVGAGHIDSSGHDEVETLLKDAIAANPTASELYAELGLMYLSDGRPEDSIEMFDAAVLHNPAHMAGLSLGAIARADISQELDVALAMIDRASAMAPDEAVNQDIMGWVLVRQGALLDGLALLEQAASSAPDDVTIQYHLGVGYQMMDQPERASQHLLAALAGPNYNHNVTDTRARYLALNPGDEVDVQVNRIDDGFEGESIGTITIATSEDGLRLTGNLEGLEPGSYASHIHEYANCEPGPGGPGSLAGGHYGHHGHHGHGMAPKEGDDPHAAHDISNMTDQAVVKADPHAGHDMSAMKKDDNKAAQDPHAGHNMAAMQQGQSMEDNPLPTGDLESFVFDVSGTSATVFESARLTLDEVRGRTIMLHVGADVEGKSGPKIACGIIK